MYHSRLFAQRKTNFNFFFSFRYAGHGRQSSCTKIARHSSLPIYPGAKSWCNPVEIEQSIQEEGCEAKVIKNKACVGQCFSYYVLGTHPRKDLSDKRMN